MKIADIRKKSTEDLQKQVEKLRNEISDYKSQSTVNNSVTNKHKLKDMKRQLAQVLTILAEKNNQQETK